MLAILGGVSWGISGVCSQYLFTQYDLSADWLTAIRMLLSGILLLVLAFRKEHTRIFKIWTKGKDTFWLIAFALAGLLLCQYTFLAAIKHSNSATATVLQSLNVVLMAIVMAVWNKKMMSRIQIAAIVLAFSGTYLIATKGSLTSIFPTNLDLPAWIIIAVIVIIGTAVGFSVFLESVKYIGPVKSTLLGCLEPASATLLSALLLGTKFTAIELIGFVFVVGTVFLSVSTKE